MIKMVEMVTLMMKCRFMRDLFHLAKKTSPASGAESRSGEAISAGGICRLEKSALK